MGKITIDIDFHIAFTICSILRYDDPKVILNENKDKTIN